MIRFYKYMIYRFYTWRLQKNDDTPGTTVELLMCLPHYAQLVTLYSVIVYLFPSLKDYDLTKLQVILIAFGFQFLYHVLIYNKKRWLRYLEEFKNETPKQRQKGTNLIFLYTVGSYVLFFGILIILFF